MDQAVPASRPVSPRARRGVLVVWLLLLLAGIALITRTPFVADLSAFLPATPDPNQRVLVDQLRQGAAARVLMMGIEGGTPATRAQASRALAGALRGDADFSSVHNGEQEDWASAGALLLAQRYVLSDAVTPERFSAAGLPQALQEGLSLLGTPGGKDFKAAWPRDPTGELPRVVEGLLPSQSPRLEQGVWVSRDAPRALVLASMKAGAADIDAQAAAIDKVRAAFAPLAQAGAGAQAQPLSLLITGPGVFAIDSRAQIKDEASQLALAGAVCMSLLLLLAFGRPAAVGLALLPVASGVIAGIAGVGLVFGNVHGFTLGFGSTLIGEAVDYAIYYLIQARPQPGAGPVALERGAARWLREGWPTVRLGLWTSICGFAALVFSGFPGLSQLGVFSIAGLVAAAFTTRWVLPELAPDGTPGQGLRAALGRVAAAGIEWLPRLRWALYALTLLALLSLLLRPGPLWRGELRDLSPVSRSAQQLDERLRADVGASDARTLVVANGATLELALQVAEATAQRLDPLVEAGKLGGYDSPTRVLPSLATQAQRRAALPSPEDLQARLAAAVQGLPFKASAVAPFIDEVRAARERAPLTREDLQGTALGGMVDAMLLPREAGGWSVLLSLQAPGAGDGEIDAAAVRLALADVQGVGVVDLKQSLDALYAHYLSEARWQSLLGGAAVLALLALYLRHRQRWLAVCLPLGMAVVLTLAGLLALEVRLGILHLVGLLLVVAVGSNYALFFDHLRQHGRTDPDTMASLLLANLTTVISFGLIARSDIAALSAIGVVVAPGALLALLLAAASMTRPRRAGASPG